MRFDWTISLGTVIHLVSLLLVITSIYYKLVARITRVEDKHVAEATDIAEIKVGLRWLRDDLVGKLEGRVRDLEISQGRK